MNLKCGWVDCGKSGYAIIFFGEKKTIPAVFCKEHFETAKEELKTNNNIIHRRL